MCGIFGFIAARGSACNADAVRRTLALLFELSEPRGREASGLVISTGGAARVFKRGQAPSKMLAGRDYKAFLDQALQDMELSSDGTLAAPLTAFGHCRLVTNGAETLSGNNQPIMVDHGIGLHNGIIANDHQLWEKYGDLSRLSHSDSEVLFRLLDRHVGDGDTVERAMGKTYGEIQGTASIAYLRDDMKGLMLGTNNGSLYYSELAESGYFFFSSERFILSEFLKRSSLGVAAGAVKQLRPGMGCFVSSDRVAADLFDFADDEVGRAETLPRPLTLIDHSEHLKDLKRCSSCITPASYPFIEFDEHGVCNKCRDYVSHKPMGREALDRELDKYRSKDGSPDCIVAFSGGRDSSYGLHLIKKELGMNPVAFTYDWGMVTDIARRNQARMCSQLGVEHILRAADIPSKRRYIRRNIQAWLARPNLGMIPLFMAGDKYFYHYARQIRKETGIKLVIFCNGNELERTDFKSGFAGVRETGGHHNRLYGFSFANKFGLASWYALQYALNPRYFNESFFDTVGAFFQSFIAKDDFLYLFEYLDWKEEEINETLIGDYAWETAADSDNTWRIGDGYTAFINYIYHTVAGFSEYDTFRSNQIREGLITRDEALALISEDNEPKLEVLHDFAAQTGFNLEEVLTRINSIEKLY